MKKILVTAVSFFIIAGICGLPHGESSHAADDDSDMFMEPDELPAPKFRIVKSESRVSRQYSPVPERTGFIPISRPHYASISRVEHFEPEVIHPQNPVAAEQNFFPSFFRNVPLNAHSRPYKQAPSQAASIAGRYSALGRSNSFDQSILGSGDFAVVRGGTFYPDEERPYQFKGSDEFFDRFSFNNGHGRPNAQPLKQPYYPEDPFANFKDFADINAGSDPAFSHFIVIYANKNATKPHPSHPSPKNIFEQLQLLDQEEKDDQVTKEKEEQQVVDQKVETDDEKDKKLMKLSKFKSKLSKTKKIVKKYKKKLGPKVDASSDYTDPLLATS